MALNGLTLEAGATDAEKAFVYLYSNLSAEAGFQDGAFVHGVPIEEAGADVSRRSPCRQNFNISMVCTELYEIAMHSPAFCDKYKPYLANMLLCAVDYLKSHVDSESGELHFMPPNDGYREKNKHQFPRDVDTTALAYLTFLRANQLLGRDVVDPALIEHMACRIANCKYSLPKLSAVEADLPDFQSWNIDGRTFIAVPPTVSHHRIIKTYFVPEEIPKAMRTDPVVMANALFFLRQVPQINESSYTGTIEFLEEISQKGYFLQPVMDKECPPVIEKELACGGFTVYRKMPLVQGTKYYYNPRLCGYHIAKALVPLRPSARAHLTGWLSKLPRPQLPMDQVLERLLQGILGQPLAPNWKPSGQDGATGAWPPSTIYKNGWIHQPDVFYTSTGIPTVLMLKTLVTMPNIGVEDAERETHTIFT